MVQRGYFGRLAAHAVARLLIVGLHVELVLGVGGRRLDHDVVLIGGHLDARPLVYLTHERLVVLAHAPKLHLVPEQRRIPVDLRHELNNKQTNIPIQTNGNH